MTAQRRQGRRRELENGAPAEQGGRDTFRLPQRSREAAVDRLRARMAAERQETAPVRPGRRPDAPELPERIHDALDPSAPA